MTINYNRSLVSKGVFGVAVVAIAGTVGAVHYAQAATNNNVSGYGTNSQQAITAADTFQTALNTANTNFVAQVHALEGTAQSQLAGNTSVSDFSSQFDAATAVYNTATTTDFATFEAQVNGYANTATSKDQFINEFNNAKANYLNQLDAAKNQLAASLSNLGNNANVTKDQFIGGFNSDRDAYSNNLEVSKNQFAATLG